MLALLGPPGERSINAQGATVLEWSPTEAAGIPWEKLVGTFGKESSFLFAGRKTEGDVFAVARSLCSGLLDGGGEAVASWGRPAVRRYVEGWRSMVQEGGAEIGCRYRAPGVFLFVGAAHDAILVVIARGLDPPASFKHFLALLDNHRPMDWREGMHFGDRMVIGNTAYVVQKVVPRKEVGGAGLKRVASAGARLLQVNYTIENAGRRTATALAGNLRLMDSQGREFTPSSDATAVAAALSKTDVLLSELQPGVPRSQVVVFELPESEKELRLMLPGRLGDSGQLSVPFSLRENPKVE